MLEQLMLLPHVIPLHGYSGFVLVIPYAAGGKLGNTITSRKNGPGWRHAKLRGHAIRGKIALRSGCGIGIGRHA